MTEKMTIEIVIMTINCISEVFDHAQPGAAEGRKKWGVKDGHGERGSAIL